MKAQPPIVPLEYANDRVRSRISIAGICSLGIVLIQFPWYIAIAMAIWDSPTVLSTSKAANGVLLLLPTIVGFFLAIYSLWKSRISARNICGLLALIVVAAETVFVIVRLSRM